MIWETLQRVFLGATVEAWTGITSGVPDVPPVVQQGPSLIQDAMSRLGELCQWLPTEMFGPCVIAVIGCWTAAFVIHIGRVVWSMLTFGGGSV